jgi:hypothetical protein
MLRGLSILLVLVILGGACTTSPSTEAVSNNQPFVKSYSSPKQNELPKEIFILIGRGNCCSGHAISISKDGEVDYSIAEYSSLESDKSGSTPETYDPNSIKMNERYSKKRTRLSPDTLKKLSELIGNEEKLHFYDEMGVTDTYLYNIYLDKKKIAHGYEPNIKRFPEELQAMISLILNEVELYKLPGMA